MLGSAAVLLGGCMHAPVDVAAPEVLAAAIANLDWADDAAVLVGTGDIADCDDIAGAAATGELIRQVLDRRPDALVFTTGDHAYPDGSAADFEACYEPVWGDFNARTVPTPGNHDYATPDASGYFEYFEVFAVRPEARPRGYYAFDHGEWLVVVLNSLLDVDPGSVQLRWLESRLAERAADCVLAIWHHPVRSSGLHGYLPWERGRGMTAFWEVLLRHGADVVLNGHDHVYERFAKLDAEGRRDDAGLRQFTVGTGGAGLHPIVLRRRHSEYLTNDVYGVLVLALRPGRYEWAFVASDGAIYDRSAAPAAC